MFAYKTKGTCSSKITFSMEEGKIHGVAFTNGCHGNLKAISALVEGMDAQALVHQLRGITCGEKPTSCGDQLARAVEQALAAAK
jgi:uncharacterized protein (TIGR03905 family)